MRLIGEVKHDRSNRFILNIDGLCVLCVLGQGRAKSLGSRFAL
jgi:hypothetical protein